MRLASHVRALETDAPPPCPECRSALYIENQPAGRYWRPNTPPICPRRGRDRRVGPGVMRLEVRPVPDWNAGR